MKIACTILLAMIPIIASCQKEKSSSQVNTNILGNSGSRRLGVYWESVNKWKNVPLKPVDNPITPVRLLPDPENKYRIISVSLPQEVTPEDRRKKITEKWKDIYLLFPKEKTTNGVAFEVKTPNGPRAFYGDLDQKKYPSLDKDYDKRMRDLADAKGQTLYEPVLNPHKNQQHKNTAAVLTPDVLAALYISSHALNNKDYADSVRQIIEIAPFETVFDKLDDYLVKLSYVGQSPEGECRVTLEIDGSGSVAGISVGAKFHQEVKGVSMLLGMLPIPLIENKVEHCGVAINRFYELEGYHKNGIAQDNLTIDASSGDMVMTRQSEWKNSDALSFASCDKVTTKIATCGDKIVVNSESLWKALSPLWPSYVVSKKNVVCENLRLSAHDIKIGKFVNPAIKEKIILQGYFVPRSSGQSVQ